MSFSSARSAPVSSVSLDHGQPAYARADADPHQSPIRIKAFVLYAQCLKHGPCPPRLYGPRKSSVPCRVQLDVLQILWFLANPFVAHDIGESGYKNDYRLIMCGCSRYQSNLVDLHQPLSWITTAPTLINQKVYSHQTAPDLA